ncbi:hypothetical protein CALCODRAFT_502323 [Calocera cornea HHB12733]|uniref:Uncharacterized protein n=1 Tax=Calocera cornea HHB12733 TaxID=1353952 RepID=A0A165DAF4_9BASI|nr:hypothetical protein CALCODRAFT_502323 [Calocera cornea HHB12733]
MNGIMSWSIREGEQCCRTFVARLNPSRFRFLSTPLFSQAGLLPSDPPPFATVSADPVPCSLEEYQLPSPEWRWAGQGWCVDMRGDGEVGYLSRSKIHRSISASEGSRRWL